MKLGNKISFFNFIFVQSFHLLMKKLPPSPLINIDEIKPSFEELDRRK